MFSLLQRSRCGNPVTPAAEVGEPAAPVAQDAKEGVQGTQKIIECRVSRFQRLQGGQSLVSSQPASASENLEEKIAFFERSASKVGQVSAPVLQTPVRSGPSQEPAGSAARPSVFQRLSAATPGTPAQSGQTPVRTSVFHRLPTGPSQTASVRTSVFRRLPASASQTALAQKEQT